MAKYVNLDDVIEHLEMHWGYEGLREDLYELPTADVATVRHGRWEVNELGYLMCSNCAWVRYGIPLVEHYPYCPNCGARMDGRC